MSKSSVKHMSAESADKFEEELEGEDFGSLDDWETELGMKILAIEKKLLPPANGAHNIPVVNMLRKKLVTYNAAMQFLDENAKVAATVGSAGGLQAIISYITKQATEDAAKVETRRYSNLLIPHLPGYKLSRSIVPESGLVGNRAPVNANLRAVPAVNGSQLLSQA